MDGWHRKNTGSLMFQEYGSVVMQVITLIIMAVGLLSLFTFIVPGLTIIWAGTLLYGLVTGFTWQSGILFALITILMLAGNIADNLMMGAGAREKGASWVAIVVATIAAIIGTIVRPPFGGIIAALLAIFIVEIVRLKEIRKALESMKGMARGYGWGLAVRFVIGLIMIFLWLIWAYIMPWLTGG